MITLLNTIVETKTQKQKRTYPQQRIVPNMPNDSFRKSKINFKSYHNDPEDAKNAKKYLGMSESYIREYIIGEGIRAKLFGPSKSQTIAWRAIQEDMNAARVDQATTQESFKTLKRKKSDVELHIGEAQDKIKSKFLEFLPLEKVSGTFPEKRGKAIVTTGSATSTAKEITDWLLRTAGTFTEKVKYDHSNPSKSLGEIRVKTQEANDNFKISNKRTIIHVENLEDLLCDKSENNFDNIAMYNRMLDKDSKATLLFHIKDLGKADDATIASHRAFPIVDAKMELTSSDEATSRSLKSKLDEFEELAKEGQKDMDIMAMFYSGRW